MQRLRLLLPILLVSMAGTPALAAEAQGRPASTSCARAVPAHKARCFSVDAVGHRAREYVGSVTNENTIAALRVDDRVGAGCETDTWRLAGDDGSPNQGESIIFHDSTLDRVVSPESLEQAGIPGSSYIGDVTRAQFDQLRTKGGEPLPTLRRWIRYASLHMIHCKIDMKWTPADAAEVAGWIAKYGGAKYISFYAAPQDPAGSNPCSLVGLNNMRDAQIRTGIKTVEGCRMSLRAIGEAGYRYVVADASLLTAHYTSRAHDFGLKMGNKTSGTPAVWTRLVRRDSDFIIAPRPGRLVKWLRR